MKAKCIDADHVHRQLTQDKIYEVEETDCDPNLYKVFDNGKELGEWFKRRFQLLTELGVAPVVLKRVVCVKSANVRSGAEGFLQDGKEYDVLKETPGNYRLAGSDILWFKWRFQDVGAAPVATTKPDKVVDVEEERCWQRLRPTIAAHECPCGITRSMCWIHKD